VQLTFLQLVSYVKKDLSYMCASTTKTKRIWAAASVCYPLAVRNVKHNLE